MITILYKLRKVFCYNKMVKQITNIEVNGKIIGSKPLQMEDNLISIKEKIKNKVNSPFIFLDKSGKTIAKENEDSLKLEDIIFEQKIKLKLLESGIKIFLNNKNVCSVECPTDKSLDYLRKMLNDKIKENFLFLDTNLNEIDLDDENDYLIKNIIKVNEIKLRRNSFEDNNTSNLTSTSSNDDNKEFKKLEIKKEKKYIDFSKYKILEKNEDLTIYKYSDVQRQSNYKLVYQYFYDNFEGEDYNNAYVILFCGKTGDGKTTSINAFFNIIKGITLEDDYRFILIQEPEKKKKQAESQTDGVHLYYVRDYNNNPVIIIDSQGYGDTRGKQYDDMVDDAFRYVFSSVIDHINTALFIVKSNTNRLDILTKYIFSSVTSLFSEDISENFIILATFANRDTMKNGPDFIHSILTDAEFLDIQKRMDDNWWYALDSKSILENEKDKLTLYSFEKTLELYEKKILKLKPKGIKKSSEVLNSRNELRIEVNNLNNHFQDLLIEQDNLQRKEKTIDQVTNKIHDMELTISNLERDMERKTPKELERELRILNEELNTKLFNLKNLTETKTIRKLKKDKINNFKFTVCDNCLINCHEPCDCLFQTLFSRCHVFTFWGHKCEKCGCKKEDHTQDCYSYISELITTQKNTDNEQRKERIEYENKKKQYLDEMNKNYSEKNNLEKQKNELTYNKNQLLEEKSKNLNEKIEIQSRIGNINQEILYIIYNLQKISQKINDIAMNNNHLKTEDEYIDDMINKMDKLNINEKEKIAKIQQIKQNNKIFKNAVNLNREELLKLDNKQLAEKLKIIMPAIKN